MSALTIALVVLAFLGVYLQLAALTGRMLRASQCLCRKGAIHPRCPRHGWDRA
jgi:hypothetical protein